MERRGRGEEEEEEEKGESISTVLPVSPLFTHTPTLHGRILPSLPLNGHFCGNISPVKIAAAAALLHKLLHAGF